MGEATPVKLRRVVIGMIETPGLDADGPVATGVAKGVVGTTAVWTMLAVAAPVGPSAVETKAEFPSPVAVDPMLAVATLELPVEAPTPVKLIGLAAEAGGVIPRVAAASWLFAH